MAETVVRAERHGPVEVLHLDDPSALNALGHRLVSQLTEHLARTAADRSVRAVVLTGSEKAFCAGAHIPEVLALRESLTADPGSEVFLDRVFEQLESHPRPVIAAVRGLALGGGCEAALACDLIVAGESARFGLPEVRLGVIPGAGGTQRLVHAIGKAKAMRMLITGEPVEARWAESAGLVAEVVEDEAVLERALEIAHRAAANPPHAVHLATDAARQATNRILRDGLSLEREHFMTALTSPEAGEGLSAFAEKRRPNFSGI